MPTITIDADTLSTLLAAAEAGEEQRTYDANYMRREGALSVDTRPMFDTAKEWRAACRAARAALRSLTVSLVLTRIEVGAPRNGRPGYRWTTGYYVCDPITGARTYPPVRRAEAYKRARELGGPRCRIVVREDAANV